MGFGLLVIGYITVLGVLPYSFLFYSWGIYIAAGGGLLMLAAFCKLEEYNIYFKAMKYICIIYILVLLGFSPFLILRHSAETTRMFLLVSKITRICVLFAFQFFMVSGVSALAKEVGNKTIEKKAKRVMYATYAFFAAFILEFINMLEISVFLLAFTLVYYIMAFTLLYGCYMRITYEGHDEAVEEKYNLTNNKKKKNTGKG